MREVSRTRRADGSLAVVAARAWRALRAEDLLARIGGEELAALLPGTTLAAAAEVAERIRHAVCDTAIPWAGVVLEVTVSLGWAALSVDGKELRPCWRAPMPGSTTPSAAAATGWFLHRSRQRALAKSSVSTAQRL